MEDAALFFSIWDAVLAEDAQRVYVFLLFGTVLIGSAIIAKEMSELVTGTPSKVTFLGRRPTRSRTIRRRLTAAKNFRAMMLQRQLIWLGLAVFFGVVVPATILYAFLSNFSWLVGAEPAFLEKCGSRMCPVRPRDYELWVFVLNQASSALVADVINEALRIPKPQVAHDQNSVFATSAVFGFRAYMQLYAANWVRTSVKGFWNFFRNSDTNRETIEQLEADYEEAKKAGR